MSANDSRTAAAMADAEAERMEMESHRRLCSTGYPALRMVECHYRDGLLVLRGRVPTYFCKQLAQSTLLTHPAVRKLVNLIEVSGGGRALGLR